MDSVVLDTNVLLDYFSSARPEHETADDLMHELVAANTTLYVVATSLKDLYYILRRMGGESAARQATTAVIRSMTLLPVDANCCQSALTSSEPDFEDGIIRAAAEAAHVTYLISRDKDGFAGSSVPRITPAQALCELHVTREVP